MGKLDNYECEGQMTIWECMTDATPLKITKPIRLIELFAGVGSQAMALRDIGANFEHYRVVEFDKYAIASYNAIHGTDFPTMDVTKISGEDLGIREREKYTYLLTYLLIPMHRFISGGENAWDGRRERNTERTSLGSKKTAGRNQRTSADFADGKCPTGTFKKQHATFSEVA